MQPQSTFGAFLVAFTMVHGAPIISEGYPNTDLNLLGEPKMAPPTHFDPKTGRPGLPKYNPADLTNVIARDPKKSKPKGTSNELAHAKGAEVGQNAVEGLKTIMDDKLNKPTKNCTRMDSKPKEDAEKEDGSRLSKLFGGDEDDEASGDEECEDVEGEQDKEEEPKTEDKKEEPKTDKRDLPLRFAPAKRGKGGKSGSPGKSPGGQPDGGSSLGQDILTQTTSNVISDGIWYGVDQAVQGAKVKRGKGGKSGSSGKSSGGQQDGGSSLGKDILTETTGNVISDGIWYGVDQAVNQEAKVKRGKGGKGGSPGKGTPSDGGSSLGKDILTETTGNVISDGIWYGVDQAVNQEAKVKRGKGGKGGSPGKGTPSDGGSSLGKDILTETTGSVISDGIWYGVDQAVNQDAKAKRDTTRDTQSGFPCKGCLPDTIDIPIWYGVDQPVDQEAKDKRGSPKDIQGDSSLGEDLSIKSGWVPPQYDIGQAVHKRAPPKGGKSSSSSEGAQPDGGSSLGKDIATQTTSNLIADGILYGVDQAVGEDAPVKRSPKGGKFRGAGKDVLTGVVSDGISNGILYGVDAATAEDAPVKRSPRGGRGGGGLGGLLVDIFSDGISSGGDETTNVRRDDLLQRSPRGGRGGGGIGGLLFDIFSDGISSGSDEATNEKREELAQRSPKGGRAGSFGKGVLGDVVSDGISTGIWYGVDEATNAKRDEPAKRSPKGGRGGQFGKDVLTDVVSDGISSGIWYGVDEATNNEKRGRSRNKGPSRSSPSSGGSRAPTSGGSDSSSSSSGGGSSTPASSSSSAGTDSSSGSGSGSRNTTSTTFPGIA